MWAFVLRPILAVVILAVASFGAGNFLAKWLPASFSWWEKLTCSWLGGFGLLSLTLFLIGQWKFTRFVIAAVMGLSLFLAARPLTRLVVKTLRTASSLKISLP